MFEILESKFGVTQVKYLITLINASRDGLLETEIIDLLQSSKIVEGIKPSELSLYIMLISTSQDR